MFKIYFKEKFTKYITKVLLYISYFVVVAIINEIILGEFNIRTFFQLFAYTTINFVILFVVTCCCFYKTKEFKYVINLLLSNRLGKNFNV